MYSFLLYSCVLSVATKVQERWQVQDVQKFPVLSEVGYRLEWKKSHWQCVESDPPPHKGMLASLVCYVWDFSSTVQHSSYAGAQGYFPHSVESNPVEWNSHTMRVQNYPFKSHRISVRGGNRKSQLSCSCHVYLCAQSIPEEGGKEGAALHGIITQKTNNLKIYLVY